MTFYIRVAIVGALIFIYSFLAYLYFTSDSIGGDDKTFAYFKEGNYRYAAAYAEELEKSSPSPSYPLYQAYIARAAGNMDQSNASLELALRRCKLENTNKQLLEIYLNQAFNAYLTNNPIGLTEAIENARALNTNDRGWIKFFAGLRAYMKGDFKEAELDWHDWKKIKPLNPWMKIAFNGHFDALWMESHLVRAQIENGKYLAARSKLEELLPNASGRTLDVINFNIGLTYFREAQSRPIESAYPYYKFAFSYFDQVNKENFSREWPGILASYQKQTLALLKTNTWRDLPAYITTLNSWSKWSLADQMSLAVLELIDEKIASDSESVALAVANIFNENLSQGPLRKQIVHRLDERVKVALERADFEKLAHYWDLSKVFSEDQNQFMAMISQDLRDDILKRIATDDKRLSHATPYIEFWKKIEKDPKQRLLFTLKLVNEGERIWHIQKEYDKVIALMKVAEEIPYPAQQKYAHQLLEDKFERILQAASNEDNISQYYQVLKAVKELKLTEVNIYDKEEIEHQIADAEFYLSKHRYHTAKEKAGWVLMIDPTNSKAQKILEQCE